MRAHRPLTARVLAVSVLLAVVTVVAVVVPVVGRVGSTTSPAPEHRVTERGRAEAVATGPVTAHGDVRRAVRVLSRWDRARAAAYADGDRRRLADLYTRRSTARLADLALLEEYADRGLRVHDLRTQLLRLEVLHAAPRRLRLLVTDRARARATRTGGVVLLRPSPAGTRVVVLRREPAGTWRVSAVRPRSGR